ncbi:MAG TPA: HPr family phosphocarrier protein [Chloroflexia bacterium]|nr:HPr family phosphocarrier protein [Chloroflexia bacterium]
MPQATIVITDPLGLHARVAARVVQVAGNYQAQVVLVNGDKKADTRSILQLMKLGVRQGHQVTISSEGEEASQALEAVRAVLTGKSGPEILT